MSEFILPRLNYYRDRNQISITFESDEKQFIVDVYNADGKYTNPVITVKAVGEKIAN